MNSTDPRIDAHIEKSAEFAKPILNHIRELVHSACPQVEETMKWGFPHFLYKGILCSMASFKQHCAVGFWKGALWCSKQSQASRNVKMRRWGTWENHNHRRSAGQKDNHPLHHRSSAPE